MRTRHVIPRLALGIPASIVTIFLAGCNIFGPRPEAPDAKPPPVPTANVGKPTADQLVHYLNGQAAMLQSIETRDLMVDIRSPAGSFGLDGGSLMCQKPRYFRMVGKKFGSQQVLVGSNEERFWFYVNADRNDTLYHCSYTDFNKGAVDLPFPFEPEWVLEALGMAQITPSQSMRVDEDKTTFRLIEETTVRGKPVTKVTYFYKGTARGDQPQVKARAMYDDKNQLICMATIKSVTRIPLNRGASAPPITATCPQIVMLEWPAQQTKLELDLGKHPHINERLSMEAFQMPRLGSRDIDLGRYRPTGRVVPANFRGGRR